MSMSGLLLKSVLVAVYVLGLISMAALEKHAIALVYISISCLWLMTNTDCVVHMICSGVSSRFFYSAQLESPTINSISRSMTTSFGSASFVSLVLVFVLISLRRLRSVLRLPMCCILAWAERLLGVFMVEFPLSYIAIHGVRAKQGAKHSWCKRYS